ncbi:MAG: hypothetical protein KF900_04950 [Bacteroidetes bacterium]|nr:hypothetical protein [Bacteroidota bacterium]
MGHTKYDKIGTNYNSTRQADVYLTERLFHLLQPQKEKYQNNLGDYLFITIAKRQ